MPFDALSQRAQVARLRPVAEAALHAYPIKVTGLRLLNHGFNTTFRVDTAGGQKFALRLNVNSRRSPQQMAAEMAWLSALSQDTELRVPTPQPLTDGRLLQQVYSDALRRELPVALFSWLPGSDLGEEATPTQMREVGRAAAVLHDHALTWQMPPGAALKALQDPLMDSANNLTADHELLTPERRAVLDETYRRAKQALDNLYARETPRPLHADLHPWNLKWARGKLYVLDFDDSGLGLPLQDLAIAAYYLRPKGDLEAALLEGYAERASLPRYTQAEYEALVAGRNLVLLNDVLVNTTADIRAMLPRYVANSVTKLRHYLEYGQYRHDLPGLIPAD